MVVNAFSWKLSKSSKCFCVTCFCQVTHSTILDSNLIATNASGGEARASSTLYGTYGEAG